MECIKLLFIGLTIGIANVIPGFSGGTMAVVFNIYDRFVNAITLNVKKLIANWKFIVPLGIGMAAGVLLFSKVITFLYQNFPVQTDSFFTGIIVGSIPMLYAYTLKTPDAEEKRRRVPAVSALIAIVAGLSLMLFFSHLQNKLGIEPGVSGELPPLTLPVFVKFFAGGILGAIAMIIPGISGSFIMLILGIYPVVIAAVASAVVPETCVQSLLLLLPCALGIVTGILSGAKLISYLIKKFPNQTYGVILGLIIGSVIIIFPGFASWQTPLAAIVSVVCIAAGFSLSYFGSGKSAAK